MIPQQLQDPTTMFHNHSMFTQMPCFLLRISIGLLFIYGIINNTLMIVISTLIVIFFTWKYVKMTLTQPIWKNYLRTIMIYTLVVVLVLFQSKLPHPEYTKLICGILIIVDAMMGQQSRYISEVMGSLK